VGRRERAEQRFREQLRAERDRRKWSQAHIAKLLSDKGIPMHPTTIAKIEAGDRAARIDEVTAVADLFGVSLDTLLGRRAKPRSDLVYTLRDVSDTAYQSSAQIIEITSAIRDRITDVSAFEDLPVRDTLIAGCERAYGALVAANDALTDTARIAREGMGAEVRATR
jgi:transcriptional regulator with XRE-family HTH domain